MSLSATVLRLVASKTVFLLVALAAGLGLLVLANASLNDRRFTWLVAVALGLGLCLTLSTALVGRYPLRSGEIVAPAARARFGPIPELLAVALIASVGAWHWSGDNAFRAPGVASWLFAVVAWACAWWPWKAESALSAMDANGFGPFQDSAINPGRWHKLDWSTLRISTRSAALIGALLGVVALGAFFRLAHIDETPRDPTSDHAEKLLDVHDLEMGVRPIFFERNTGREPAQFYLTYGLMRATGLSLSFTTLKIGTGLVGALAIPFVYLLAAELGGRGAGLVAAALYAVGKWPVAIARAGLRFPYAPLFAAAVLWLFLRWMRTRDRRDALACGLFLGAGLYGYTPFRVVVPAVCLGLLIALFSSRQRSERRGVIRHGALIAATAAVVFVPLGHYAVENPDMFWFRATSRITGDESRSTLASLLDNGTVFARNNVNAALGFNWRGDSTMVNGVTDDPMLDVATGALLLAGLCVVAGRILRCRDPRALFIVLTIPVLTLSSTLALSFPNENPSVNREGPVAPVIFAIAALPAALLLRKAPAALGRWPGAALASVATGVLVVVAAVENHDAYFRRFDAQYAANVANTTEIADTIRAASVLGVTAEDAYVVDSPFWLDIRNIGIALGDIDWGPRHNVRLDDPIPRQSPGRPLLFVIRPGSERLDEVTRLYPGGRLMFHHADVPHQSFLIYWVPTAAPPEIAASAASDPF